MCVVYRYEEPANRLERIVSNGLVSMKSIAIPKIDQIHGKII